MPYICMLYANFSLVDSQHPCWGQ